MNRRDFLGLLTAGVAGGVLAKSAVAQSASARRKSLRPTRRP